jgi:hypothetical protein
MRSIDEYTLFTAGIGDNIELAYCKRAEPVHNRNQSLHKCGFSSTFRISAIYPCRLLS